MKKAAAGTRVGAKTNFNSMKSTLKNPLYQASTSIVDNQQAYTNKYGSNVQNTRTSTPIKRLGSRKGSSKALNDNQSHKSSFSMKRLQ